MQVQQEVDRIDHRPHGARAPQFGAVQFQVVQRGRFPHAVEILVDEAGGVRPFRVPALVRLNVGEGQRDAAAPWAQLAVQQGLDRDRAAHLVAVGEGVDHGVAARLAAVESVDVGDAGIALGVGRQVGEFDFDRIGFQCHACSPPMQRYLVCI